MTEDSEIKFSRDDLIVLAVVLCYPLPSDLGFWHKLRLPASAGR